MKKYYVSIHGGEGWESIVNEDDVSKEIDAIIKYWPRVPVNQLLDRIYIFPMDSRFELIDIDNRVLKR